LKISVVSGHRYSQLAKYIEQNEMDIVVTGLSKFNLPQRIISSVSISRLAKKTNIPVLAVRSSGLICHYKKIVLSPILDYQRLTKPASFGLSSSASHF